MQTSQPVQLSGLMSALGRPFLGCGGAAAMGSYDPRLEHLTKYRHGGVASARRPAPKNDDDGVPAGCGTSRRSDAGDGRLPPHPSSLLLGWADPRRIAASLVVAVLLPISTSSSSFLALLASRPSAAVWVFC